MNLKLKSIILLIIVNLFSGFSLSAMDENYFNNIGSNPAPVKAEVLNEDSENNNDNSKKNKINYDKLNEGFIIEDDESCDEVISSNFKFFDDDIIKYIDGNEATNREETEKKEFNNELENMEMEIKCYKKNNIEFNQDTDFCNKKFNVIFHIDRELLKMITVKKKEQRLLLAKISATIETMMKSFFEQDKINSNKIIIVSRALIKNFKCPQIIISFMVDYIFENFKTPKQLNEYLNNYKSIDNTFLLAERVRVVKFFNMLFNSKTYNYYEKLKQTDPRQYQIKLGRIFNLEKFYKIIKEDEELQPILKNCKYINDILEVLLQKISINVYLVQQNR